MLKAEKPSISQEASMLISAKEDREHNIYDFLARPVVLIYTQFQTSDPPNAPLPLSSISFPGAIWTHNVWADKMKGFRYWKGTLNFQVQVNASPFDIGRLWLFWSPFDADRGDLRPFYSRTHVTGFPGIEIDLGNKMTTELKIPYVSPFSHVDQLRSDQPYGTIRLYVLSPFESSNDTTVDVTVYCWMTDCSLAIPTDTPVLGLQAQSGKESQVRSVKGLVTGGASLVGEAARMFANTPVVGEIAKPLSWVADATAGAASLIGLSKPTTVQAVSTFANIPARGFTHSDDLDNSIVLGLKPDNAVQNSFGVFGTDQDEMNFSYITSKPNWFGSFLWRTIDDAKTDPLFKIPIHPGICGDDYPPTITPDPTILQPTHMAYLASAHRYWRGGISFRFSVVKNQYYSGRLVFIYYAGHTTGSVINYGTFEVAKCPQWVWDIKEDSDLQITIPYASNVQYLATQLNNPSDVTTRDALGLDVITGTLAVFVENKLRGPATVPDHIYCQMWAHGGSDLAFGIGDMVRFHPYTAVPVAALLPLGVSDPITMLPPKKKVVKQLVRGTRPLQAQMMRVESTFNVNHTETGDRNPEGSSLLVSKAKDNMNPEMFCLGEIVNNLRPYTRRFGFEYSWASPSFPGRLTLDPAYFFTEVVQASNNPINYFMRMYVFYRGSVRYKLFFIAKNFQSETASDYRWICNVSSSNIRAGSPEQYSTVPADTTSLYAGRFTHKQYLELNPVVEITCPYYSNVPIQIISKTYLTDLHQRMRWKFTNNSDPTLTNDRGEIWKAGGDDFTFGYLVGAPMLVRTGLA